MTIGFNISLPYGWSKEYNKDWFNSHAWRKLSTNKSFEWQTYYTGWSQLFSIDLDLIPTGQDHAGVGLQLCVLGFQLDVKIYDDRHWDSDNDTWEKYDEQSVRERMSRDDEHKASQLENARRLLADEARNESKKELSEFLETPQGQALIDQRVKAKLEEQRTSKDAKAARGEQYRLANQNKMEDK